MGRRLPVKFNFGAWIYRIAPEPEPKEYRPFTFEEFKPHRDRWMKNKDCKYWVKASQYSRAGVEQSEESLLEWGTMAEYYIFDDTGEPCGVEI